MQAVGRTIAGAYDAWSHSYNTDHNATRDLSARVLQSRTDLVREKRVLEVGCGTGLNTIWLAEHAAHVTALDFSPGMLAQAVGCISVNCTHIGNAAALRHILHGCMLRNPPASRHLCTPSVIS